MKAIINSIKTVIITITAVLSLSFTTASIPTNDSIATADAELNFIGKEENQPIFKLVLNNNTATQFVVIVREGNGDIIFTERLKSGTKSRVYKLDTDNTELITGTTFEVVNKATKQSTVYKISNYNRFADTDVTIAKL